MSALIPWRLRAAFYRLVQARRVNGCSRTGMVSFTFDDFPRSALEVGGAILAAKRLRGTYYASAGLAGTDGPMGPLFTKDDLERADRAGHEIGGHTYSHIGAAGLPKQALLADIGRNQQALAGFVPHNFSYPMGLTDFTVAAFLGRHFDSCRGIAAGLNGEGTDLNLLKAVALYSEHPEQRFFDHIAEARRQGAWLIFYTHDVADSPSRFGCSIDLLERVVAAAHGSGAMVAPIRDCLAALAAPAPLVSEPSAQTA
jgi:peptidoglycan/xylan/chitin deacetylase (PgdA/CDA1 family)